MNIEEIARKFNKHPNEFHKRADGRIEWCCGHGVGHTVYNSKGSNVHGCDGCCRELKE